MSTMRDLRDKSRAPWGHDASTFEAINTGSLQRIADATEKMALRHTELIGQRDSFERRLKAEQSYVETLRYQLRAAKGQITKLKNKLEKQNADTRSRLSDDAGLPPVVGQGIAPPGLPWGGSGV